MKKKTWIGLVAIVILVALMVAAYLRFGPKATQGEKSITISVDYADGHRENYTWDTNAEFLKEAADEVLDLEGYEDTYGFTITAINGAEANMETDNAYWCIYVNGEYGQYGVDTQPVSDGDAFLFAYETF